MCIRDRVRGLENVPKKFLIQAAACNLALLLRSRYGSGKPRAAHDRTAEAILMILVVINTVQDLLVSTVSSLIGTSWRSVKTPFSYFAGWSCFCP